MWIHTRQHNYYLVYTLFQMFSVVLVHRLPTRQDLLLCRDPLRRFLLSRREKDLSNILSGLGILRDRAGDGEELQEFAAEDGRFVRVMFPGWIDTLFFIVKVLLLCTYNLNCALGLAGLPPPTSSSSWLNAVCFSSSLPRLHLCHPDFDEAARGGEAADEEVRVRYACDSLAVRTVCSLIKYHS